MQKWTSSPAVLPGLTDEAIKKNLRSGNPYLLQAVAAHMAGKKEYLTEKDPLKLQTAVAQLMIDCRNSGKSVVPMDCSPIFEELCKHAGAAMPLDGFGETTNPFTQLQKDYILDEMRGFPDDVGGDYTDLPAENKNKFHVAICGSGVNGIGCALRCQAAGIPYTVFERDTDISGTWHQNFYPGVRCDTPSATYSFSHEPNPNWSNYFAYGPEVKAYLKRMCDKHGVTKNCKCNTNIEIARWNEETSMWDLKFRTEKGPLETMSVNVYVGAVGQLSNPNIPIIPGQDIFSGEAYHTARYKKGLDFTGKNVVVMGTGATAMGICPEIKKTCKHLTIFQGTPQWYVNIPNHKMDISEEEKWCFRNVPFYERWYRFGHLRHVVDFYTDVLTTGSDANKSLQETLTEYIKGQVENDPELVAKMVPKHPPICTRMLVDNHWCKMMLDKDKVTLIPSRAKQITSDTVIGQQGEVAKADIIIYATGFQSTKFCTASMQVYGKGGVSLQEDWGSEPTAYLGMTRPNFPNFFMTYGPNTNVSSGGSIIWCAETAGRYIGQCCQAMVRNGLKEMQVKPEVHDKYNDMITKELKWTAWADTSCVSWYKPSATAKVTNNLPMGLEKFWSLTRRVNMEDFITKSSESKPIDAQKI